MKRLLFFVLLFSLQQIQAAKINGHFVGALAGDRFTLRVNRLYLDGTVQNYELNTGNIGQFSVEFALIEPQYVTLQHHSDILVLYVEPDDEIDVISDILTFPTQVSFDGRGGENNRFLQAFLRAHPVNFNEFTKTRFKIANYWATIDTDLDARMRKLDPTAFSLFLEDRTSKQLRFMDHWEEKYPNQLSPRFKQFLTTEIMYMNGFDAIVYANVYKTWHNIPDAWLDAVLLLPLDVEDIGSESYRRFIMAYMAMRCKKSGKTDRLVESQFLDGGNILTNKGRAFFQSEIICNALKDENYSEVLPYYSTFLQENTLDDYEQKITDLFQKKVAFAPGLIAPPFVGLDHEGLRISDADLRGSVVYLNFWASYCGTCIKKMEYINTRYAELHAKGIKVVNVSLDKERNLWVSNINRYKMNGFHLLSESAETSNLAKDYKVEAVPTYFILDKNGSFVQKPASHKPEDLVKFLLEQVDN